MPRFNIQYSVFYIPPILIVMALAVGFYLQHQPKQAVILSDLPVKIETNQSVTIPIIIDTDEHVINAIEVYLAFDPSAFKVESISKESSFIQIWITDQPSFSNEAGTISLAGGLPNPGFSGRGTIGSVELTPLKSGIQRLTFDPKTRILLNDGLGSQVDLQMRPIVLQVK